MSNANFSSVSIKAEQSSEPTDPPVRDLDFKGHFPQVAFSTRSVIFLCLVISRVELIRKDKEKFRSARKFRPVENGL